MKPVHVSELEVKIGDMLMTVNDFVVVENVDEAGPVQRFHTRSVRDGKHGIVTPSLITGIMVTVNHTPVTEILPQTREELIVPATIPPPPVALEPSKPKMQIIKGPAVQPKTERHTHDKSVKEKFNESNN